MGELFNNNVMLQCMCALNKAGECYELEEL